MATENGNTVGVMQIGETAGEIWNKLDSEGTLSYARLVKDLNKPRDIVMQAVGWLAREEKVEIRETNRGRQISLH